MTLAMIRQRYAVASVNALTAPVFALAALLAAPPAAAGQSATPEPATFSKDVAPILQRSCENCHRAGGGAPMSLVTYTEARPWARAIKARTAAREMPPWFVDKNIGIQRFKDDPSLSDAEIATIAAWADAGAPQGDPADLPPPREWTDRGKWSIGTPDLVVSSPVSTVEALAPDWYGMVNPPSPTGLTADRWIKAVEIREVIVDDDGNEVVPAVAAAAAGGAARADLNRSVVHHSVINARLNSAPEDDVHPNSGGESAAAERDLALFGIVHELGQNATVFPDYVGVKLPGDSVLTYTNIHLHSIGERVHVRVDTAFKFHPEGYEPKYVQTSGAQSGGFELELDIPGGDANVMRDGFFRVTSPMILMTFEPHLHSSGKRMCIEAIYPNNMREMRNCADYNHNWVKVYVYEDDAAPLLPAGTLLHLLAWYDNSPSNPRVSDPRNWKGWGNRSIDDMFYHLPRMIFLTEEQFETEVAARESPPLFATSQDQQ
ncbi:MAG: hypothetical protein OXF27_16340 [Acidobacteria bacterium]|nr:hypothetical protein [Acidobacteriota bacterium]